MKKWHAIVLKALGSILLLTGIYFFCESQTQGFRFHHLISNLPNDPRWETPCSKEEYAKMGILLNQKFTYIGRGGFCYAFLGEDQKTVIKFYAHNHLNIPSLFKDFLWKKLSLKSPPLKLGLPFFQELSFKSCMLLKARAQEKAGLIYTHLNKTTQLPHEVLLIDNIGIRHTIDPNQTEFVLQHKAEFLVDYIARCVKERKKENALRAIDSYLDCLLTLFKAGARDLDQGLRKNYGILENGTVIAMDISHFVEDASLQRPANYKKEIVLKSHNLAKWLKKNHEDLFEYCDEKLTELLE